MPEPCPLPRPAPVIGRRSSSIGLSHIDRQALSRVIAVSLPCCKLARVHGARYLGSLAHRVGVAADELTRLGVEERPRILAPFAATENFGRGADSP